MSAQSRLARGWLAVALGVALAACGGGPDDEGAGAAGAGGGDVADAGHDVEPGTDAATDGGGDAGGGDAGDGDAGDAAGGDAGDAGDGDAEAGDGCVATQEVCNGADDDCDGVADEGFDLAQPDRCGACDNDCFATLANVVALTVTCTPAPMLGAPGQCSGQCATNYWDLDPAAPGCEYYCAKVAGDDASCDGRDDDCDGQVDEDVDLCTSVDHCGACGRACRVAHGQPSCVHQGGGACDAATTACAIASCTCNGPGDCWFDVDGAAANGCEYGCFPTGPEVCNGLDDDCDGKADDDLSSDPSIGVACQGGTVGVCADPAHAGTTVCTAGAVACAGPNVLLPGALAETCNGLDDDCDGVVDDSPGDVGAAFPCGASATPPCARGVYACVGGSRVCVGNVDPQPEACNGRDDDCNGAVDDLAPGQIGAACAVPTPPPAGATGACKAGTTACVDGAIVCTGAVVASPGASDGCGVDANCDGQLTGQPSPSDVHNCGGCGNDCTAGAVHASWACATQGSSYACVFQGCQAGWYDNGGPGDAIAGDHKCGYACSFVSADEACNGADDDCDGQIDEQVAAPSPSAACGVSPEATSPECSAASAGNPGGVSITCVNGGWQCTFRTAGVCSSGCTFTAETCDGKDNDCDGLVDENVPNIGKPCASDDGKPPPGDGPCRTTGVYVCYGGSTTKCSAAKDLSKAGPELCDGVDNDCDGAVDETFASKGSDPTYFVKPTVVQVGASLWVYAYEASRPSATATSAGTGNGYVTAAPFGVTLDETPACSVSGHLPWFGVTGPEVDQICAAVGGHTCSPAEWTTACEAKLAPTPACTWGYSPAGAACTAGAVAGTKYCNLAASYDFDPGTAGLQSGLLPGASAKLAQCSADWSGTTGNVAGVNDRAFDVTGNLRELAKVADGEYVLLGGSFLSDLESGAACTFTAQRVDAAYSYRDTGFRCCFSQDPTK